jgi:hypothetical protein
MRFCLTIMVLSEVEQEFKSILANVKIVAVSGLNHCGTFTQLAGQGFHAAVRS